MRKSRWTEWRSVFVAIIFNSYKTQNFVSRLKHGIIAVAKAAKATMTTKVRWNLSSDAHSSRRRFGLLQSEIGPIRFDRWSLRVVVR